jgi:hypothetical protein
MAGFAINLERHAVPEHSATLPVQSRLHRIHAHRRDIVLCVLLLATLMMPVSYRAGTGSSHAHTIFQTMIDAVTGTPHSHGEPILQPEYVTPSPFAPLALPLTALVMTDTTLDPAAEPDTPVMLQLTSPISATAAIQLLALIVASMLLFSPYRPTWSSLRTLRPRQHRIDTPPPRPA